MIDVKLIAMVLQLRYSYSEDDRYQKSNVCLGASERIFDACGSFGMIGVTGSGERVQEKGDGLARLGLTTLGKPIKMFSTESIL